MSKTIKVETIQLHNGAYATISAPNQRISAETACFIEDSCGRGLALTPLHQTWWERYTVQDFRDDVWWDGPPIIRERKKVMEIGGMMFHLPSQFAFWAYHHPDPVVSETLWMSPYELGINSAHIPLIPNGMTPFYGAVINKTLKKTRLQIRVPGEKRGTTVWDCNSCRYPWIDNWAKLKADKLTWFFPFVEALLREGYDRVGTPLIP